MELSSVLIHTFYIAFTFVAGFILGRNEFRKAGGSTLKSKDSKR